MIKKITVCFLVMAIVAGCAQAPGKSEKLVDPPVVEHPQKPVEQEKPEEETKLVKKIDESKDWVYVNTIHNEDMSFAYENLKQEITDLEYTNGDDFENWYNTVTTYNPEIIDFTINIDSNDVEEKNNWIKSLVKEKLIEPKTKGEQFLKMKWFKNTDVLSIIIKSGFFLPQIGHSDEGIGLNIDLTDGTLISLDVLLQRFHVNNDLIADKVQQYFQSEEISACNLENQAVTESCYVMVTDIEKALKGSVLFVENNILMIEWKVNSDKGYGYFKKIEIKQG